MNWKRIQFSRILKMEQIENGIFEQGIFESE